MKNKHYILKNILHLYFNIMLSHVSVEKYLT